MASASVGALSFVTARKLQPALIATHKDKDGSLPIKDDKTGETLPLQFVEIHQPVRYLKKDGQFFVCTDFRKPGSQDEYYDIDFWVNQKTGKLAASVAPTSHNDPKRTFEKVRRVSPARRRP